MRPTMVATAYLLDGEWQIAKRFFTFYHDLDAEDAREVKEMAKRYNIRTLW